MALPVDVDDPLERVRRASADAALAKESNQLIGPELVARWLGPRGLEMSIDHFDCRTGGSYRYLHSDANGEYAFHGSFHEVRPDTLIVQTFTFEGMPDGVALEKLVLEDLGDGRTRLTSTSLCDSFADRDAMLASGMEVGVREGYERLDEVLARS